MQLKGKKQIKAVKPEPVKPAEPIMPAATPPVQNLPVETVNPVECNAVPEPKFFGEGELWLATTKFADMTVPDKKPLLTDLERRKLRSRLNYACPESRDVIQTIVEILERL